MQDFIDKQETGCFQDKPILALACSRALALVLHSSGSDGCIASRGGRGAPTRSGGDLTPAEAMTRSGSRSDVPPTGGRIPGCAGGPALRLERVRRSRTAPRHTSPAPASRIPVRYAGEAAGNRLQLVSCRESNFRPPAGVPCGKFGNRSHSRSGVNVFPARPASTPARR
jgi:hypothetical protein